MRTLSIMLLVLFAAGCGQKTVSFREQIQPILNARCTQCHGQDRSVGKIVLTSYEGFMNSRTISGKEALVVAGEPYKSRLYILCETNQPHFRMPPDTSSVTPLPPGELDLLRHWITQGAKDN